jgi:hypothetical protein
MMFPISTSKPSKTFTHPFRPINAMRGPREYPSSDQAQSTRFLRGVWIPGVIDPAARGRSQVDGTRLIEQYSELGLLLAPAENAVEAGLYAVWERLSDGRLFVFSSLQNWLSEFRIYRRDEKGKIVKQNDHLMDATRYLVMSGAQVACREPREGDDDNRQWIDSTRNEYTGY